MSTKPQRLSEPSDTFQDPIVARLLKECGGSASAVCSFADCNEKTPPDGSSPAVSKGQAPAVQHSSGIDGKVSTGAISAQALKYEKLKEGDHGVIAIEPHKIRLSNFKNRSSKALSESDPRFVETRESIRAHGQDTPIWVHLLGPDASPYNYELVAGRRRHAACMALGIPVLALVKSVSSDVDLALMMFRENADRQDLSPVECGRMFQDWLDRRIFSSQKEIGAKINRDNSVIARYIRLAGLPESVFSAFEDDREIKLRWCDQLTAAVAEQPDAVFRVAAQLKTSRGRKATEVFEALINASSKATRQGSTRRSHTLRQKSVRVGGRVPLKIVFGRHKVVLQTQHLNEEQENAFVRTVAEHAERSLRELLEPDSLGAREK